MPLTSTDDLARTRSAFDSWRAVQSGRRRLPDSLWTAAVALLERYSLSLVARELRLNPSQLRKRQLALAGTPAAGAAARPHFVQVCGAELLKNPAINLSAEATLRLVIERPDGSRLTLGLPASEWPRLEALYTAFVRP